MSKIKRIIYKKISPFVGNIFDTLFLTNFSRRGLDYYHNYNENDYTFSKESFCLIHVPRTGGGTLRTCFSNNNKFHIFNKKAQHYPVSFLRNPEEYKYVTVIRDPVDRTISHYNMLLHMNSKVASYGFSNWLRNDKFSRNLFCQYFSGYVYEEVNQSIYELALKNLKNFFYVVNFKEFDSEIKELFKKLSLEVNFEIKKFGTPHSKKYEENLDKLKILAENYNYWDIKLYNEFLTFKNR